MSPEDSKGNRSPLFESIRVAPKYWPCPCCGRKGRRKTRGIRFVRSLTFLREAWLRITYGVYRSRCDCQRTFRSFPEEAPPSWRYTRAVRRAVVDSIIRDQMPTTRVRVRLREDFLLSVSVGFIYECLDWAHEEISKEDYQAWVRQNFSGVLCIDELHDSRDRILFLATDPLNNFTVYFVIAKKCDQVSMDAFLDELKAMGIVPLVVITDGSPLYHEALGERWRHVEHQLCVFHILKKANEHILRAIRALAKTLPKRKKYGRGRPRKGERRRQLGQRRAFVMKRVYLVVKRTERWTKQDHEDWKKMLEILPDLETIRCFVEDLHALFQKGSTKKTARFRRTRLVNNPAYRANPHLDLVCRMLPREKFDKMITFLGWDNVDRTSNHVERSNRSFRQMQKTRYKRRRATTITKALWLFLIRRWKQHPLYRPPDLQAPPRAPSTAPPTREAA